MLGAMRGHRWAGITVLGSVLLGGPGCFHTHPSMVGPDPAAGVAQPTPPPISVPPDGAVPRELSKITLPPYVIEAPDNLLIEVVRVGKFPVPDPKDDTGTRRISKTP
jgi:polysaccharide export outer membrane protein